MSTSNALLTLARHSRRPLTLTRKALNCSSSSSNNFHANGNPLRAGDKAEVTAAAKETTISKAMHAYMKRAKEHQEFMEKQEKEFVFGRRHLANMMGKDPESFSQQDIDEAIRYLFPSGLFEPKARPMMRPPQEVYPKQKAAQFDISGRPFHSFFYTAVPNFYHLMHEMVGKLSKMNESGGGLLTTESCAALGGTKWISKTELEGRLLEKLNDKQYSEWLSCMERMALHPARERELEFLKSYRRELGQQAKAEDLPPITLEPDGRKSCFVPLCMHKTARAEVKVTVPGSGRFNINGQGLEYFQRVQSREGVITPLQLVGWLGKVDVDAYVMMGESGLINKKPTDGETIRAGAIRWGIATGIAALGADKEVLRLAGMLIRDYRQKERTKVGRVGARARWTWKKR